MGIDGDRIAIVHEGNQPAGMGFGGDVAHHHAPGAARDRNFCVCDGHKLPVEVNRHGACPLVAKFAYQQMDAVPATGKDIRHSRAAQGGQWEFGIRLT